MQRKFRGRRYMDLNLDPTTVTVQLKSLRGYATRCHAKNCRERATTIARKLDAVGGFIRQIELCDRHAEVVAERERGRGLKVVDERA